MISYFKCGFIILGFFVLSCNKNLLLPDETSPRLVVWGALHPDSIPTVHVSLSFGPLTPDDVRITAVSGANVLLYENNRVMDTLHMQEPGKYASKYPLPLRTGAAYCVSVTKEGFPSLKTLPDTMPPVVSLLKTTTSLQEKPLGDFIASVDIRLTSEVQQIYLGRRVYFVENDISKVAQNWSEPNDEPCSGFIRASIYGYTFVNYACLESYDKIVLSNPSLTKAETQRIYQISLAFFSASSLRLFEKIGLFYNQNIRSDFAVDPFFEAIYLPIEANGGYGRVSCYNSIVTRIKF